MMECDDDLFSELNHEIIIIDECYLSQQHNSFHIKKLKSDITKYPYTIVDKDNNEIYSCMTENDRIILCKNDKTPVVNGYVNMERYNDMYICGGKDSEIVFSSVKTDAKINEDSRVYTAKFYNKASEKPEEIKIICDKSRNYYSILGEEEMDCDENGHRSKKEVLIGKFIPNISKLRKDYTVEVSSNVDTMYMLALGIGFIRLDYVRSLAKIRNYLVFGMNGLMD